MFAGISTIGMSLNIQYERPASGPVLEAHEDVTGNVQIGDGLTDYPDGTPVVLGDTLTQAEYDAISSDYMRQFEDHVRNVIDDKQLLKMTQYQFDACVILTWNIGRSAFSNSDVLRYINKGSFEDAAFHFGDWVYSSAFNTFDEDGNVVGKKQYGDDGNLLKFGQGWTKALRGLYRRHLSEACLFMGCDWRQACHEDEIELEVIETEWQSSSSRFPAGRWKDIVGYKTPWGDVLRVARQNPLPKLLPIGEQTKTSADAFDALAIPRRGEQVLKPIDSPLSLPATWNNMSDAEKTAYLNNRSLVDLGGDPGTPGPDAYQVADAPVMVVPEPKPKVPITKISKTVRVEDVDYLSDEDKAPGNITVKDIGDSRRGRGFAKSEIGKVVSVVGVAGMAADQMNAMEPVIKFTEKYSMNQIAYVFIALLVLGIIVFYYGKWEREVGEDGAEDLLG